MTLPRDPDLPESDGPGPVLPNPSLPDPSLPDLSLTDPTSPALGRMVAVWGEKMLLVAVAGGFLVWLAYELAPAAWLFWSAAVIAVSLSVWLARWLPAGTLLRGLRYSVGTPTDPDRPRY